MNTSDKSSYGARKRLGALTGPSRLTASLVALALLAFAAPASGGADLWNATVVVKNHSTSGSSFLGYGTLFPGSTASPSTFTVGSTTYTVSSITNSHTAPIPYVNLYLSPLPSASTVGNWTLHIGSRSIPFSSLLEDTSFWRWQDSSLWGSANTLFTDGASLTVKISSNAAPTLANAIPDQTAMTGTAFSYQFPEDTFNDTDTGDTLTYQATKSDDTALPTWLSFNATTRTFTGTPTAGDTGTVSVKVTASDGDGGSVSDEFDITVVVTPPTVVPADWSLKPAAVAAGAKFRLLFLSSTKRNGSSTDIATYNTFVQDRAAAGHTGIQTYSAGFRAVGCTAAVDARDNTATTYTSTDMGVPIYWLNGAKAADDYEDFYDGSWDDEANDKNESGTDGPDTSSVSNYPITGCDHDGTEDFFNTDSRALGVTGSSTVRIGRPDSSASGDGPISSGLGTLSTNTRPLYGQWH